MIACDAGDGRDLKRILAAVLIVPLVGCNTVAGAGEDVEAAGEGVQELSEEVEKEL